MRLDVNDKELIDYTVKLNNLHRSAYPIAVRQTLNNLAFNTRSKMPRASKDAGMVKRQKTSVYRLMSQVEKAQGWDVSKMESKTGIYNRPKMGVIAEGLATHEKGGVVPRKSKKIPYQFGRESGRRKSQMREDYRARNIRLQQQHVKKGDTKKLFKVALDTINSPEHERYMVYNDRIWHIKRVTRRKNKTWIKGTPIYKYNPSHTPRLKKAPVIDVAKNRAYKDVEKLYKKNAQKRFDKYLK